MKTNKLNHTFLDAEGWRRSAVEENILTPRWHEWSALSKAPGKDALLLSSASSATHSLRTARLSGPALFSAKWATAGEGGRGEKRNSMSGLLFLLSLKLGIYKESKETEAGPRSPSKKVTSATQGRRGCDTQGKKIMMVLIYTIFNVNNWVS